MSVFSSKELVFEGFEILGQQGLFTNLRVKRDSLPEGIYAYDLRDCCDGEICEMRPHVMVNHWGTVLLKNKIEEAEYGLEINEDDYSYTGVSMTLSEFLESPESKQDISM